MHRIGANRRNNNNNYLYNNAVNHAIEIKNQLQNPNQLPPHCTLVLHNEHLNQFETCVMIEFTHPHSNHTGHVLVGYPEHMTQNNEYPILNGYVHMLCSIDAFNGYFMEITVNSLAEMLGVVALCQNLLEYQPEQRNLEFVRVPQHLNNHWAVPQYLRERNNLNLINNPEPIVG